MLDLLLARTSDAYAPPPFPEYDYEQKGAATTTGGGCSRVPAATTASRAPTAPPSTAPTTSSRPSSTATSATTRRGRSTTPAGTELSPGCRLSVRRRDGNTTTVLFLKVRRWRCRLHVYAQDVQGPPSWRTSPSSSAFTHVAHGRTCSSCSTCKLRFAARNQAATCTAGRSTPMFWGVTTSSRITARGESSRVRANHRHVDCIECVHALCLQRTHTSSKRRGWLNRCLPKL